MIGDISDPLQQFRWRGTIKEKEMRTTSMISMDVARSEIRDSFTAEDAHSWARRHFGKRVRCVILSHAGSDVVTRICARGAVGSAWGTGPGMWAMSAGALLCALEDREVMR